MFYGQDLSAKVTSLNIFTEQQQVIFSVALNQISSLDIIQITGDFEVTNPYNYNVMIGSLLVLATTNTSTTGIVVDVANAFNVTPDMHHGVVNKARSWQAPNTYTNYYLNLVGYAASTGASPGDSLIVEQGYGHLDAIIIANF